MPRAFLLRLLFHCRSPLGLLIGTGCWPHPGSLTGVVIDVISPSEVVLPTLPTRGQATLSILKRAESGVAVVAGSCRRSASWGLALTLGRGSGRAGSISRKHVWMEVLGRP